VHYQPSRRLQNGAATVKPVLVLLGAAWLLGCAPQTKVSGGWQDNTPRPQPFARVLIVGVTPNINQRCAFEYFLASRIQSDKTDAIRSCDAVADKYAPLTRESIDQAVAAQQADAVVATILVARQAGAKSGGDRDTRGGAYYKATDSGWATGYYGAYGVPVLYGEFQTAPSITTVKGDVKVETKVYATHGATLVYTLQTSAKDLESRDEAFAVITTPIADRLHREGLVR